jgi:hypothetical protein
MFNHDLAFVVEHQQSWYREQDVPQSVHGSWNGTILLADLTRWRLDTWRCSRQIYGPFPQITTPSGWKVQYHHRSDVLELPAS